jgi:hypothetical protein
VLLNIIMHVIRILSNFSFGFDIYACNPSLAHFLFFSIMNRFLDGISHAS